jgi:TonB dependent receptor
MRISTLGFLMAVTFSLVLKPAFCQQILHADTTINLHADTLIDDAKDNLLDNIPIVSLDENDNQDGSAQNISTIGNASRDPFLRAATFNFNVVRFRTRGYDADLNTTYMNGVQMENLDNGFTPFGLWGGLNDIVRNRQNNYGIQANTYGFGGVGGANTIDTRAFKQRKQTSISYALSNRNYVHKFAITHSTGFNKKGWAFSVSGSRRWADEGFTDGTYYNGWSFYTGIDKKINERHILSFVAFATPTENGRQGGSVDEIRHLANNNFYNPYWGYQNGKKRNSSIAKSFQPFGILTHDWKISSKTNLTTAVAYTFGNRSITGLDWYNAPDPRPDYYRYLPSHFEDDPIVFPQIRHDFFINVNRRQINWDGLYNINYNNKETIFNANGVTGNTVSGNRSLYILEERFTNTKRFNFNTTYNTAVNKNVDISAGFTFEAQKNNYFKTVNDLLGGKFYVDINQFAGRDFGTGSDQSQNDVNRPNRILREGDKFGYDYNIGIQKTTAWAQTVVKFHAINFFLGAEHTYTRFWREGNVKNGLFPNNSFGKSANYDFYNYAFKAGITFKPANGHIFFLNATYETKAPFFDNAFLSVRTRDNVQDNLSSEKVSSAELGYVLTTPTVKFRATGFYTIFKNAIDVLSFYDDYYRSFGNYSLSNIGKEHAGVELGAEVILYKGLALNAAASIGRYRYNTRQNATITVDNTSQIIAKETIYSKNFNIPTPQEAYSIGLSYRSPQYWNLNISYNYFDQMWMAISPVRRTEAAVSGVDEGSTKWHEILDQTKLTPQGTLDANASYSWLLNKRYKSLKKRTFLVFNLGISNILNNTDIVTGAYEQLRFDYLEKDVNKFAPKKSFAYGTTFNAGIALRF